MNLGAWGAAAPSHNLSISMVTSPALLPWDKTRRFIHEKKEYPPIRLRDSYPSHSYPSHSFSTRFRSRDRPSWNHEASLIPTSVASGCSVSPGSPLASPTALPLPTKTIVSSYRAQVPSQRRPPQCFANLDGLLKAVQSRPKPLIPPQIIGNITE